MNVITFEYVHMHQKGYLCSLKIDGHLCLRYLSVMRRGTAWLLQGFEGGDALGTLPDTQPGEPFVEALEEHTSLQYWAEFVY